MDNKVAIGSVLAGAATGASLMYFLDPDRGRRRRALVGDKVTSLTHRIPEAAEATGRDLSNRAYGIWSEATKLFSNDNPTDQVIEARLRSKLGRVVSNPQALRVTSNGGDVRFEGDILQSEAEPLLQTARAVSGVKQIDDSGLQVHRSRKGVSSLQGSGRKGSQYDVMQENWSPATRVVAGTAGAGALAYGLAKRDALGAGIGLIGAALAARSATNLRFDRLIGTGGGREAVTVQKTITIDAPLENAFKLWSNFENFPMFMSNVLEVSGGSGGLSHWKVEGPGGVPIEWDAEITRVEENEMIAWKSVEGSTFANAGYVLFEETSEGATEVTVRISYNPPGGAIGHALAMAFGADPRSQMDEGLVRMKHLLEGGGSDVVTPRSDQDRRDEVFENTMSRSRASGGSH